MSRRRIEKYIVGCSM